MSKEKNKSVENIETVDGLDDEVDFTPPAPATPLPVVRSGVRNLTNESIRANLLAQRDADVAKVGEDEIVKAALPVLKDGKPVRDANGFVVIEEKTVLKRDKVASDWDKRIATVCANLGN
jgi:hypothetical protein